MKIVALLLLIIISLVVSAQNDTLLIENNDPEVREFISNGIKLLNGETGIEKDTQKAFKEFEKGANKKDDVCQYLLGRMYEFGSGVEVDDKNAEKWYKRSAENGNALAQIALGRYYKTGKNGEVKFNDAVKWFHKSAEKNVPNALYSMGYMYFKGFGVEQDYCKAVQYFSDAVRNYSVPGAFMLGYCYENGYGVETNPKLAAELYEWSALYGYEQAQKRLEQLNGGIEKSAFYIPENISKVIPVSHLTIANSSKQTNLIKNAEGYLVIYDWSGQKINEVFPIRTEASSNKGMLLRFGEDKNCEGEIIGNSVKFKNMIFNREGALNAEVEWKLNNISFIEEVNGDNLLLIGDVKLYSPELKEPGEPAQIVLLAKNENILQTESLQPVSDFELKAYPNPFNQQVKVEFSLKQDCDVTLFVTNMAGQMVKKVHEQVQFTTGNHTVEIKDIYRPGMYLVVLKAGNSLQTVQIIKNN